MDLCQLRRCSGETRCRTGRVPWWKGVGRASDTRIGGEIFTDYYFGEANTANKSDNQTIHAENKFLIFVKTGLLQDNTTNKGSRPEIQDDPGERGRGKEKREA